MSLDGAPGNRRPGVALVLGVRCLLVAAVLLVAAGCANVPYRFGNQIEDLSTLRLRPGEAQIEAGRPVAFVDGLGHYVVSLPTKLLLWNWRVENHHITPETQAALEQYLDANGLHNVKVRLNQYAPGAEWSRLFRNHGIGPVWRYTLGVISVAYYTILPGRVFGGDDYNPFTNTINIYSDLPVICLHEGGHAKDFTSRSHDFRGWYSFMSVLPLVDLYQEAMATGDAIGYLQAHHFTGDEQAAYRVLYPAYCTYLAADALVFIPVEQWVAEATVFVAVIPGHIVGRIRAANVEEAPAPREAEPAATPAPAGN